MTYRRLRNWQKYYEKHEHRLKKTFWRWNYPVAIVLFVLTIKHVIPDTIIIFYTLLCSVYANEETSAGASHARKDGD